MSKETDSEGATVVWRTVPRLPPLAALDKAPIVLSTEDVPARRLCLDRPLVLAIDRDGEAQ